jgi:hypothetical protein
MANVIRLVNKASDATVLFDFDNAAGTGNPNSLKTVIMGHGFNLGVPPSNAEFFESDDSPGGTLTQRRHGLTQMSFYFRPEATTSQALFSAIGTLGQYLDNPIEYRLLLQLEGWSEKRYADVVFGSVPALLQGQNRGLFEVLTLLKAPQGIEVLLWRQPYLSGPPVTVGPTTVQNDPADASGRFIEVTNAGNAPAPAALKVQGDTGAKVQEIVVARKSAGPFASTRVTDYTGLTQYSQLNADNLPTGWDVTLATGTTSVADTDASGGNTAQTTHATNPTVMNKQIRLTRTANLDSLRGTFDVYVRIKNTAAAKHVVQLRWAHSLADPATFSETEVIHDTTDLATFAYVDVKLGRISVPKEHMLGGVALEFWSRRDSGSGNLMWDFMSLVPADESLSTIYVPGGSSETWYGRQLVTPTNPALGAGVVSGNFLILNAANEAGGTPPVGGLAWPAGRHRVRFRGSRQITASNPPAMSYTYRVRNVTDTTTTVTANGTTTTTGPEIFDKYLEFDSVAAKSYQPQILFNSGTSSELYVDFITHSFTPAIAATEEAHSDPEKGLLHKMDSSDNLVLPLGVEGPLPLWLAPGLNALYLHYAEVPIVSGAPGGESKLTRDCAVTVTFSPRYLT